MDQNAQEWHWLINAPEKLLTHYQSIISGAAARFVARGFFRPEERDELVQEINLQLLEKKLAKMKEQYSGAVLLRTYFAKIVQNALLEIARTKMRQPALLGEEILDYRQDAGAGPEAKLIIRDELLRLEAILKDWPNAYRTRLSFKLWTRSPLHSSDVQFYQSPRTAQAIHRLAKACSASYDELSEGEVFDLLVELLNIVEAKNTDGDSLRRWNLQQADRLIGILNGIPPVSNHSRESLRMLLRMYFDQ